MTKPEDRFNRLMGELYHAVMEDLKDLLKKSEVPLVWFGCTPGAANPYQALGLDPSAPDDLVKLAYKLLSHKLHPDHGGSAEAMARLNRAYQEIAQMRGWK